MSKEDATKGYSLFVLPYYISNNGDGSASLIECASIQEANDQDDEQTENDCGWGEPSSDELEIYVNENGQLYWCKYDYDYATRKANYEMIPLVRVR